MTTPLPPLPEPQTLIIDADVGSRAFTPWQMRAYAQQVAQAERKAALLWAAEQCEQVVMMNEAKPTSNGFRYLHGPSDCAAMLRAEAEKIK